MLHLRAKSAIRYAKAFYEIAQQNNRLDKFLEDFALVSKTVSSSEELKHLLILPTISDKKKFGAIEAIFKSKVDKLSFQCLEFLVQKNRLSIIEDVEGELKDLYYSKNAIKKIEVTSAISLNKEQLKKIEKTLSKDVYKKVIIKNSIDKRLIGGFKIRIDDQVYDCSILSQLERFKKNFTN